MKLAVYLLLLTAVLAEEKTSRRPQSPRTDKRALVEGNAAVEKRAPVLSTVAPPVTPGIEYADVSETHREKSPSQQIFATPLPQIAKISDVLTGQGPFQAAIASHLLSPVSIYQPRISSPTFEVSAPVASQLAYSEHKISYQPFQNALPQFQKPLKPLSNPYQQYQRLVLPNQVYQPQIHQQLIPQFQQAPLYQYQPQIYQSQPAPFTQTQPSVVRERQQLVEVTNVPGITYTEEQKTTEGELKASPTEQSKILEKPNFTSEQNYKNEGATSYASFSLGEGSSGKQEIRTQPQPQQAQLQYSQQTDLSPQPQYQQAQYQPQQIQPQVKYQQLQPQLQYQPQIAQFQQPLQYQQVQPQQLKLAPAQQLQYQPQQLIQLQPQAQIQPEQYQQPSQKQYEPQTIQYQIQIPQQYQPAQQYQSPQIQKVEYAKDESPKPVRVFFRQGPSFPQLFQPQDYQAQGLVTPGYPAPQTLAAPTFAPVQYYGKFAQNIFGNYQQ